MRGWGGNRNAGKLQNNLRILAAFWLTGAGVFWGLYYDEIYYIFYIYIELFSFSNFYLVLTSVPSVDFPARTRSHLIREELA
jgi:hypothetical protein